MKAPIRGLIGLGVAVAVVTGIVATYRLMRAERDADAAAEAPVVAPTLARKTADGAVVLELDAATQSRLGLRVARLEHGTAQAAAPANARVLDPAPLVSQLDAIRAAEAEVEAARKPYDRLRGLYENNLNASAAAVEAAEARLARAKIARDTARNSLISTWGPTLTRRADLAELARALSEREQALVRVDLLLGADATQTGPTVDLFQLTGEAVARARVLGPAPSIDSTVAGRALLALVGTDAEALVPGALLAARFEKQEGAEGFVLPRDCVVREGGQAWVYVQQSATTFTRHEVSLDRPHPDGWLVTGDWSQPVVVAGAQSLLSEERKSGIRMRD